MLLNFGLNVKVFFPASYGARCLILEYPILDYCQLKHKLLFFYIPTSINCYFLYQIGIFIKKKQKFHFGFYFFTYRRSRMKRSASGDGHNNKRAKKEKPVFYEPDLQFSTLKDVERAIADGLLKGMYNEKGTRKSLMNVAMNLRRTMRATRT